jgi:tetrahydromethanopterin S-methyltransferase subunit A
MERIAIVGRLLSENKGIDQIIKFTIEHPELKVILLCGHEVIGHKAGQALLSLHKNGVDDRNRIIGAQGPDPIIQSDFENINKFRKQVTLINMIGTIDIGKITRLVT